MWINEHTDGWVVIGSAPGPAPAGLPALLNGFRRAGLSLLPAEKHLGIRVSDAEQAERELLALGATRVSGERETGFWVLTDPVGHPFCIIFGHDSQCPGGDSGGLLGAGGSGPGSRRRHSLRFRHAFAPFVCAWIGLRSPRWQGPKQGIASMSEQRVERHSLEPIAPTRLEPDAIGIAQDTVIGMASSAPAATAGLTLAALAAASAYGAGIVLVITAVPMLIIANSYRRLNQWNPNCGASFEWVGRTINPYLGYMTGWLMLTYYVIGGVALIVPLGPSVLEAANLPTTNKWSNLGITAAVILVMLVIAVIGIRLTARTQIAMAAVEYAILVGLATAGLVIVAAGHHPGAVHLSTAWLKPTGIGGRGSLSGAFLISAFVIAGWDGTMYVNEETKHRRVNPGKAAIWAAALLAVLYTLIQVGLQGVVSPTALANNSTSALVYTVQSFGGAGWGRVMAVAIALSVIATTGVGIVLTARIIYGMASWQALPTFLANVSRRRNTPVAASILTGFLLLALIAAYLIGTSLQSAFDDLLYISSWLTLGFYMLTALAMTTYYRRQIFAKLRTAVTVGLLPLAAVVFLGWVLEQSIAAAPLAQKWSLIGLMLAGIALMLTARFVWKSNFFSLPRESEISAE
jgi:amino acid transporter